MDSIQSLIQSLSSQYNKIKFVDNKNDFMWSPSKNTIFYDSTDKNCQVYVLHELAHCLLNHASYSSDAELIKDEVSAWAYAQNTLGKKFGITISNAIIKNNLETYRCWIYKRSKCPFCGENGMQIEKNIYKCIACSKTWKVNEARQKQLKRQLIK